MIRCFAAILTVLSVVTPAVVRSAESEDLKSAIHTIRQVGPEGKGSAEAAGAWKVLARDPDRAVAAASRRDGRGHAVGSQLDSSRGGRNR